MAMVQQLTPGYGFFAPAGSTTCSRRAGDPLGVIGADVRRPGHQPGPIDHADVCLCVRAVAADPDRRGGHLTLFHQRPYEPTLVHLYDLQTTDQDLDLFFLNAAYSGYVQSLTSSTRRFLDSYGLHECHDGRLTRPGPTSCIRSHPRQTRKFANHAINRHPRMYHWTLAYLQLLQDSGMTLYNDFLRGGDHWHLRLVGLVQLGQQPGTGDPTLDALNISNPDAATGVKSEAGGAISRWAALVGGSGAAGSYLVAGIPASGVGTAYQIAVLLDGAASAPGVVTFGAASGIAWGGTVAIGAGGTWGLPRHLHGGGGLHADLHPRRPRLPGRPDAAGRHGRFRPGRRDQPSIILRRILIS